jgi:hypothetical protein
MGNLVNSLVNSLENYYYSTKTLVFIRGYVFTMCVSSKMINYDRLRIFACKISDVSNENVSTNKVKKTPNNCGISNNSDKVIFFVYH